MLYLTSNLQDRHHYCHRHFTDSKHWVSCLIHIANNVGQDTDLNIGVLIPACRCLDSLLCCHLAVMWHARSREARGVNRKYEYKVLAPGNCSQSIWTRLKGPPWLAMGINQMERVRWSQCFKMEITDLQSTWVAQRTQAIIYDRNIRAASVWGLMLD